MAQSGSQLSEMLAATVKALAIFAPIGIGATVSLNLLDASRPVVLAVVLAIGAAGSLAAGLFDIRYQDAREMSSPDPHGRQAPR